MATIKDAVSEVALDSMKSSPYNYDDTVWYSYRNEAFDSTAFGDRRFMAVGSRNTVHEPPKRYPDSHLGTGWAFLLEGPVNLDDGSVDEEDRNGNG